MNKPRILVASTILPTPTNRGDRARLFHILQQLSQFAEVRLVGLQRTWETAIEHNGRLPNLPEVEVSTLPISKQQVLQRAAMSMALMRPFMVYRFMTPAVLEFFKHHISAFKPDLFWGYQLDTYPLYPFTGSSKRIMDVIDSLTFHFANVRQYSGATLRARIISLTQLRLAQIERQALQQTDHTFVSSPPNLQHMQTVYGEDARRVSVLRAAVPEQFLNKQWQFQPDRPLQILFVGYLPYPPNTLAVQYAIREIMPHIWSKHPDAKFIVCGGGGEHLMKEFSGATGVIFKGFVDDLVQEYLSASVLLVPAPYAAGIQTKLVEGMATGLPAVVSKISLKANGVNNNQEVMAGDTAEEMAAAILAISQNAALATRLSNNSRAFVIRNHTAASQKQQIQESIERLLA